MQLNFPIECSSLCLTPYHSIKKWKRCWMAAVVFFCLTSSLWGNCFLYTNAGPEIYSVKRVRQGGTHQRGRVDAAYACIERRKPCGWYLGAEALYGRGILKGKSGSGQALKSHLTDEVIETRVGFNLQQVFPRCSYFIPFAGWGYFRETNDFIFPSPHSWTFIDSFQYAVVGFLSGVNFTRMLSMGICFKTKFMLDGKSRVSNDPPFDDVSLIMKNEMQMRFDIPITYGPIPCSGIGFQLVPFYEFRHFGGRLGFPFNFKDTKLYLYGARATVMYTF